MVFDNKTNKIEKNINKNTIKIYDYNNGNNSNNSRRVKYQSFINNRLGPSEQFKESVIMI